MVGRISTILHEARHCETPNSTSWPHVFCPDEDPTKDYPGCDETILGAYGVEVIFLKNLKKNCESCGDKVKRDAEIYGDAYEGQIIDASVKDAASAK